MKKYYLIFLCFILTSCSSEIKKLSRNSVTVKDFSVSRKIVGLIPTGGDNPYLSFVESTNASIAFYSTTSVAAQRAQTKDQAGATVTALDANGKDMIQSFKIEDIKFNYINESVGYKTEYPQTQQTITTLSTQLLNMFGKQVRFQSSAGANQLINEMLYIPQYIKLTDQYSQNEVEKITSGTPFNWNKDQANTNGVVIRVTAESEESKEIIENIAFTEDDGNFSMTTELLDNIPSGANVLVEVIRGNLKIQKDVNGNSYKMYAYSACGHSFVKQ